MPGPNDPVIFDRQTAKRLADALKWVEQVRRHGSFDRERIWPDDAFFWAKLSNETGGAGSWAYDWKELTWPGGVVNSGGRHGTAASTPNHSKMNTAADALMFMDLNSSGLAVWRIVAEATIPLGTKIGQVYQMVAIDSGSNSARADWDFEIVHADP